MNPFSICLCYFLLADIKKKQCSHGTLFNVMCQHGWEGNLGENGYMYMAESFRCSPETTTTLVISYIPIQNQQFEKRSSVQFIGNIATPEKELLCLSQKN